MIREERRDSERTFSSPPMKMDGSPPSLSQCCWEVIDGLREPKVTETKLASTVCALCVLPFSQGVWEGLGFNLNTDNDTHPGSYTGLKGPIYHCCEALRVCVCGIGNLLLHGHVNSTGPHKASGQWGLSLSHPSPPSRSITPHLTLS